MNHVLRPSLTVSSAIPWKKRRKRGHLICVEKKD